MQLERELSPPRSEAVARAEGTDFARACAVWGCVLRDVHRYLRGIAPREAEDVAAEAVLLALQRFGAEPANWSEVFGWCCGVARRLAVNRWRRARMARVDAAVAVDELPAIAVETRWTRTAVVAWVAEWRASLCMADNQTLDLMLADVHNNAEIARLRGRRLRSVQDSRAWIAQAARAWNPSRSLHA